MLLPGIIYTLLILVFMRPVNILVHELGHALGAIFYAKRKASVWLGTYGDKKHSVRLKMGVLEIWILPNLSVWNGGVCVIEAEPPLNAKEEIAYVAGGPAGTLLLAFILAAVTYIPQYQYEIFVGLRIALIYTLWLFFWNIIPRSKVIVLEEENTYNDGYQLRNAFRSVKVEKLCQQANTAMREGRTQESIDLFQAALRIDPEYPQALNNIGFILCVAKQYENAIPYLDKALEINPTYTHALNNRAWAKMNLGDLEGGKADFLLAMEQDADNVMALRNLGFYYLQIGEKEAALRWLEKAKTMDNARHLRLDDYIDAARK